MTTIPIRDLLRQPAKVKRLTRAGEVVRITERGMPLWDVQTAALPEASQTEIERLRGVNELLDDLMAETPLPSHAGSVPISNVVMGSR